MGRMPNQAGSKHISKEAARHVGERAAGEGLQAERAAGAKNSDGHERLEHLDEGDAQVEVRRVAQPQRAWPGRA